MIGSLLVGLILASCGGGELTTGSSTTGSNKFLDTLQRELEEDEHLEEVHEAEQAEYAAEVEEDQRTQSTNEAAARQSEEALGRVGTEETEFRAKLQAKINLEDQQIDDEFEAHQAEQDAQAAERRVEDARSAVGAAREHAEEVEAEIP